MPCCKKVSIAVITYNSRNTVIETLDSIAGLRYVGPLELIVSDDKSTDDTVAVVEEWLRDHRDRFCCVKLLQPEQNTGVTANVNRAVEAATGEYIRFIAGDDRFTADAIQLCADAAERENAEWVVGKCRVFSTDQDMNDTLNRMQLDYDHTIDRLKHHYDVVKRDFAMGDPIPAPCAFFFSLGLIKRLGGFDPQYRMYEDYPFLYKLFQNNIRPVFADAVVCEYRISSTSISRVDNGAVKKRYDTDSVAFFFNVRQRDLLRHGRYLHCAYLTLIMLNAKARCLYGSEDWRTKVMSGMVGAADAVKKIGH